MQTVFDQSLGEAAGVGWGQPPGLCSQWLCMAGLCSKTKFTFNRINWHRATNDCGFGWFGLLGALAIPVCWGAAPGVPRAQAGLDPSELSSCMSALVSSFTSVWIFATSPLSEAVYPVKVPVGFPIAVVPWALTGVSHFVQSGRNPQYKHKCSCGPCYTKVLGLFICRRS